MLSDYGINEKSVLFKQKIAKISNISFNMANIENYGTNRLFGEAPKWR